MTVPTEFLTRLRVQAWDAEHLGHWHIANTLRDAACMLQTRYTLVSDDDGHEYVVPAEKADAFYQWLAREEARYEETPEYADRVEGMLTFLDPRFRA